MGRRGRPPKNPDPIPHDDDDEVSVLGFPSDDLDEDPDIADLNNPDVETLSEPPLLGTRPQPSEIFGETADTFGRATSPRLYAQAANFPSAVQLRAWRWENGVPVALGPIDAEATEEDFVRHFFTAMPKPGEGRFQFRLRPIDIRGRELGKEITLNVSEHHIALQRIREAKKREEEERMGGPAGWGGRQGDIIVNPNGSGSDAGSAYAEEMGRMFESAVEAAERRTEILQQTLEQERERLRLEEQQRVQERISTAERASGVVEKLTDRLMATDRQRAEEVLAAQKEQSNMMVSTLTTVFSQQSASAREAAERQREIDARKAEQDRVFFERQREQAEEQRRREREEFERRQQVEREEVRLRMERERMEMERQRELMREERERWRQELEEKRRMEQMEWERKLQIEREERERRERQDRDRFEREKLEAQERAERERREWDMRREEARREDERRERERREELERREERRREEMMLQQKQMELTAQRDREHSERMTEMARLERESQREAQLSREKSERDAREAADKERQRQHELALRDIELGRERDREHQERMMQLQRVQNSGGLGAITDMLGMETPELLARIFGGGGGGEGGGWADAIPKVLGSIAEIGKVAVQQNTTAQQQQHGRRALTDKSAERGTEKMVMIQTPQGQKIIPLSALTAAQQANLGGIPLPGLPRAPAVELPDEGFRPPSSDEEDDDEGEDLAASVQEELAEAEQQAESLYDQAEKVNVMKRSKEAGMPLLAQKKARKAIRVLAEKLNKAPEDDWVGIVTEAITSEMAIFDYIKAVTVYAALAEAKTGPELADRIVRALKESGLIPVDLIPYDEADFTRLASKEA